MISIKSIIPRLPKSLSEYAEDTSWMEEYAVQGLNLMEIRQAYENKVCLLEVSGHTANTPKDLKFIEAVSFMKSNPDILKSYINISNETTVVNEGNYKITTYITTKTEPKGEKSTDSANILRIQHQGVINNYLLWVESDLYRNNFEYLTYVNKPFIGHVGCLNCPQLNNGNYHYTTNKYRQIVTPEIKEGIICLAYLAYAKDDQGYILIPDNESVKSALVEYIKFKYFEDKVMNDRSYFQMYQDTRRSAEDLMAKAKGNMLLKEVNLDDLVTINERYFTYLKK